MKNNDYLYKNYYRRSNTHTKKEGLDLVETCEITVYDELYLYEARTVGAYDEDGNETGGICGKIEIITNRFNCENLEKMYKYFEDFGDYELYFEGLGKDALSFQATTWASEDAFEELKNRVFYFFIYGLEDKKRARLVEKILPEIKKALFQAMRNNLEVMAEFGDDEELLKAEIEQADEEILKEYIETFLH